MGKVELSSKWQLLSLVLATALAFSVSFNLLQYFNGLGHPAEPAANNIPATNDITAHMLNFTFSWPPEAQNVVNGTLWLNVTFLSWKPNDTRIIVRINDDDYDVPRPDYPVGDWIALIFDWNEDGSVRGGEEIPHVLYANNVSQPAVLMENCHLMWAETYSEYGPHNVTFNNQTGYTFRIQYPLHWDGVSGWSPGKVLKEGAYNPMRICFSEGVYVQFRFYVPESG